MNMKMSEKIFNKVLTTITFLELRGSFTFFKVDATTLSKKKKLKASRSQRKR